MNELFPNNTTRLCYNDFHIARVNNYIYSNSNQTFLTIPSMAMFAEEMSHFASHMRQIIPMGLYYKIFMISTVKIRQLFPVSDKNK